MDLRPSSLLKKRILAAFCSVAQLLPAASNPDRELCGNSPTLRQEARFLAERAQLRRFALTGSVLSLVNAPTSSSATVDTPGNVAVIPDSDGIRVRRNPFNLQLRKISFQPTSEEARAYRVEADESAYDRDAARNGAKLDKLGDDDTREVALPFEFRFHGQGYRSVFVNSDGNLTFEAGDNASSDRTFSRMTAGPPRIAVVYADMDPSAANAFVSVLAEADRVVVSWSDVPFYNGFFRHSFQVTLRASGRMELDYGDTSIQGESVVTGIAPGRLQGQAQLVGLGFGADGQEYAQGVAEIFTGRETYDVARAIQRFYATHDDAYDMIFVFNALQMAPAMCSSSTAIACEDTVRNQVRGFGRELYDEGAYLGSPKRLEGVVDLGSIDGYPADPNAPHPQRPGTGDKGINILGHEASHRFLVWLDSPVDGAGQTLYTGRQGLHWNFNFNSEGSLVEGNRIEDLGEGANPRFYAAGAGERVSPVDQYFFGWRSAADTPGTFVVRDSSRGNGGGAPSPGARFNGRRQDVSVEELIERSGGPRYPDHDIAPRKYRWATILLTRDGQAVPDAAVAKAERYVAELPLFWDRASEGRSQVDMRFKRSVDAGFAPFAELQAGQEVEYEIRISRPAEQALTLQLALSYTDSLEASQETVTIAAGESSAKVTLRAKAGGVTIVKLRAPDDPSFEEVEARIRVWP